MPSKESHVIMISKLAAAHPKRFLAAAGSYGMIFDLAPVLSLLLVPHPLRFLACCTGEAPSLYFIVKGACTGVAPSM